MRRFLLNEILVAYSITKGWREARPEDLGILWEHYVFNEFLSHIPSQSLRYWRDKRGHEVDFVVTGRGCDPIAVECKWRANALDVAALTAFRNRHPKGEDWIVAQDVEKPFQKTIKNLKLNYLGVGDLGRRLAED